MEQRVAISISDGIADVRLVRADSDPAQIRVATSDRALSERVSAAGAHVYPAEKLRNLIDPR